MATSLAKIAAGNAAMFAAGTGVSTAAGPRPVRAVIRDLEQGARAASRAAAAHALSSVADGRAIAALERAVANRDEDPEVRGYAAEALAHLHRRESHLVLAGNLTDPCDEVRFWCAFALGEIAKLDALSLLESLSRPRKRTCGSAPRFQAELVQRHLGSIWQQLASPCRFCIAG